MRNINLSEEAKVAIFIGLPAGYVYAQALIWLLGRLMVMPLPGWFNTYGPEYPHAVLFITGLATALAALIVIGLPLAHALLFLFRRHALLAAIAISVGAFVTTYLFSWSALTGLGQHFSTFRLLAITEVLIFFGGPIALVWLLGRTHNMSLKGTSGKLRLPTAP